MEKVIYGIESVTIGPLNGSFPILTEHEVHEEMTAQSGPFELKFEILNMDPLIFRRLSRLPKWKPITIKLKHSQYARPVYIRDRVPKNWTVDQVANLRNYVNACYEHK